MGSIRPSFSLQIQNDQIQLKIKKGLKAKVSKSSQIATCSWEVKINSNGLRLKGKQNGNAYYNIMNDDYYNRAEPNGLKPNASTCPSFGILMQWARLLLNK
ncbi:hypothetical protein Lal_00049969 [Lupinus albus]|nr:hypothetical protein Lal_00049969 [Lupinus albus]